jgi:hypothetical protein
MAASFSRGLKPAKGSVTSGVVSLFGNFTSSGGTAASVSCDGFSIAKTTSSTGRYTVTLDGAVTELLGVNANVYLNSTTAYTNTAGCETIVREEDVDGAGTFYLQFVSGTDHADANVVDGAKVFLRIDVKQSSVNP